MAHKNDCSGFTVEDYLRGQGARGFLNPAEDLGIVGDYIGMRYTAPAAGGTFPINGTGAGPGSPIAQTDPNVDAFINPSSDTKWWLIILAYRFTFAHRDLNNANQMSELMAGTFLTVSPQGKLGYVYQAAPGAAVDVGGFGLQLQTSPADLTRTWARAETPFARPLPAPILIDMEADTAVITSPVVSGLSDCFVRLDLKGWAVPKKRVANADQLARPEDLTRRVRRNLGTDRDDLARAIAGKMKQLPGAMRRY